MIERRIDLLQKLAVFGGVTDEVLKIILNCSECVDIYNGNIFFSEGDPPDGMYVLEIGMVDVFKSWEGQEYHLSELGPGDCFGEMSLVDFSCRSASVRAMGNCRAIKIPTKTLSEIARVDVEQFALVNMNMGREICRRLRRADDDLFQQMVKRQVQVS